MIQFLEGKKWETVLNPHKEDEAKLILILSLEHPTITYRRCEVVETLLNGKAV